MNNSLSIDDSLLELVRSTTGSHPSTSV